MQFYSIKQGTAMSVFADRYLCRTRAVEGLVDNWKFQHDEAMAAMDVDEVVQECLDLSALCQHAWSSLRQIIRRDPNGAAIDEAEEPIKTAIAKTQHIFTSVQELVAQARKKGFAIQDTQKLPGAAQAVFDIKAKIDVVYFQPNEEQIRKSREQFERGECQTIEELIREIQGERPA